MIYALFYLIALIQECADDNSMCLEIQRAFKKSILIT